jgi:hypothetical protein
MQYIASWLPYSSDARDQLRALVLLNDQLNYKLAEKPTSYAI